VIKRDIVKKKILKKKSLKRRRRQTSKIKSMRRAETRRLEKVRSGRRRPSRIKGFPAGFRWMMDCLFVIQHSKQPTCLLVIVIICLHPALRAVDTPEGHGSLTIAFFYMTATMEKDACMTLIKGLSSYPSILSMNALNRDPPWLKQR
jgi:hypothetical protein